MKIQISFVFKKIRSAFNENTDQFFRVKKIKFAFNENTNQFFRVKKKKKSDLHLMKIKINFLELKKYKKIKNQICI